jgi:hypothetical protein
MVSFVLIAMHSPSNIGITALGALTGAAFSAWLNHKLKPHVMEIARGLFDLSDDDIFYLRNKIVIDRLGQSLADSSSNLAEKIVAA